MQIDLSQRTILLTGASGELGRKTAVELAKVGAHCILMARQVEALQKTAQQMPEGSASVLSVDLTDSQQIEGALEALPRHVDAIVHCAAPTFKYTKLHQLTEDDTEQQFQVGVHSMMQMCTKLLPEMMLKRWGRVVFASSLASLVSGRGAAHYNMVKSAQESLIRSIALEYGRYQICANALRLGPIDGERLSKRE